MGKNTFAHIVVLKKIREKMRLNHTDSFQFYSESYADSGYNDYADHSDYYDAY